MSLLLNCFILAKDIYLNFYLFVWYLYPCKNLLIFAMFTRDSTKDFDLYYFKNINNKIRNMKIFLMYNLIHILNIHGKVPRVWSIKSLMAFGHISLNYDTRNKLNVELT